MEKEEEGGEEWGRGRSAVAKRGRGKVKQGKDSIVWAAGGGDVTEDRFATRR